MDYSQLCSFLLNDKKIKIVLKNIVKRVAFFQGMVYNIKAVAEMAERSNAHDSKSCDAGMYPRVQIPFSAPQKEIDIFVYLFLYCTEL